jgi:hypothetical protein
MVGRRARTAIWGLGLLLAGCGGRSADLRPNEGHAGSRDIDDSDSAAAAGVVGSGPWRVSDAGATSSGAAGEAGRTSAAGGATNPAGTGSGGSAGTGSGGWNPITGEAGSSTGVEGACTGEECRLVVEPSPLWITPLKGYGRGPAWIRFSATDELVYIGAGQDLFTTALDRSTGQIVGIPQNDRAFVATDASGRWVVRQSGQDCVAFKDESAVFRFQCTLNQMVRFSADGSALAHHSCLSEQDQLLELAVYDTASGARIAATTLELPCLFGGDDWNALVDSQHRRTLFAHPAQSDLYVFDWATQAVTARSIHQPFPKSLQPLNHEGTILNLSLSHDGQRLVSVGAADGLAWHDVESLDVVSRIGDVPFFNIYDKCYCTYLTESPVAWSPADEIYATAHHSGGIELRSVATQETLAVLDPPSDPEVIKRALSNGFGPALIQFAPDLRQLVALYPQYAVGYSLSR